MSAVDEPRADPIVAHRRLRISLRALRTQPDLRLTQKQVAKALDWSPSKLLRIEAGQVPITTSDLIALLTHYGVTDKAERDDLVELARISRRSTLRDTYRDVFSREFAEFVLHEAYATVIRQYETKLVPGVLQTEEYAEAIIRTYLGPGAGEDDVARRVRARLERSNYLLNRHDGGPEMSFILDEAVIQRQIGRESGNRTLMVEQLEHLKLLSVKPNIQIRVIPFDLGMYAALRGPFELIEFEDPADANLLYLENPNGDELVHEDSDEIAPYIEMLGDLEELFTTRVQVSFERLADPIIRRMKHQETAGPAPTA